MQFQMACAERQWVDYVSFDPRMPPELQLYVQRVNRDTAHIRDIEAAVEEFLAQLQDTVDRLLTLRSKSEPQTIIAAG